MNNFKAIWCFEVNDHFPEKKNISPWPIADVSHGDFSDLGVQFQKNKVV